MTQLAKPEPESPSAAEQMETLDFHQSMILDRRRVESFRTAIEGAVSPGDVVLDIGTGTGLLACLAAHAGARRVYAIEEGDIAAVAARVVADNGFGEQVEVINLRSTEVELPELADVVVSETIGNMGFDEGIVAWIDDARNRLARPQATIIPHRLETIVAAADVPVDYAFVDGWSGQHFGLDLTPVRRAASETCLWTDLSPVHVFTAPASCLSANLTAPVTSPLTGRAETVTRRSGTVHGIGAWFHAEIAAGVSLTNEPPTTVPSWSHVVLPLENPFEVAPGTRLAIELSITDTGTVTGWSIHTA